MSDSVKLSSGSRRTFIKTVAISAGSLTANPLGLFGPRSVFAGIPSGEYMRSLTDDQFWFQQLLSDKNDPSINTADAQLSIRLGISGGFAVGYFNTLGFLSDYREQKPDDYKDLLLNIARLPKTPKRLDLAAHILENHRKFAEIETRAIQNLKSFGFFSTDNNSRFTFKSGILPTNERFITPNDQSLTRPLERMSKEQISKIYDSSRKVRTDSTLREMSAQASPWDEASSALQSSLQKEFDLVNPRFERRFDSMDSGKAVLFKAGKLDLSWLDHRLFPVAFNDGIKNGRIAALAYMALVESGQLLSSNIASDGKVKDIDNNVMKFRDARILETTFGDDDFWRHGLDLGAFRPSVRLKTFCLVKQNDGQVRRIELLTPFLPFDASKRLAASQLQEHGENQDAIANAVTKYFSDTSLSRHDMPITTQSISDGAFDACSEILRHTYRLIRATSDTYEPLRGIKLEHVSVVPEVTSPWTFAGVGGALFNAYLTGLRGASEKLETEEERLKFRWSVSRSVDDLLKRSVNNDSKMANSSAPVPAMVQYASGYRAANLLSEGLTDKIAQGQGARLVYDSLVKGMPEFFKPLPADKFLTAEEIAGYVLQVSIGVQTEVEQLRLKVRELENMLKQFQQFNEKLVQLIENLKGDLSGINNRQDLADFQKHANELVSSMRDNLDLSQAATLSSLQGLVNTFVQVGINIEVNIQARLQAEAKINVQICSVGGVK